MNKEKIRNDADEYHSVQKHSGYSDIVCARTWIHTLFWWNNISINYDSSAECKYLILNSQIIIIQLMIIPVDLKITWNICRVFAVIYISLRCAKSINQNFVQNSKSPLPDCLLFVLGFISQIIKPPKWLPNQTKERISFYFIFISFFLFLSFPMVVCVCCMCIQSRTLAKHKMSIEQ